MEEISDKEEDKKNYFSRPDIQEALNIAKDLAFMQNMVKSSSISDFNGSIVVWQNK